MDIKQEKLSFSDVEESDSETEDTNTAALLSKIKVEPPEPPAAGDDDEDSREQDFREDHSGEQANIDALDELIRQTSISGAMELKLKHYFKEFTRIKPLPATRSFVDIDLADPDEETWIIQCPASVDIHSELLNKKLNLSAPRSKIKRCSKPLEAHVTHNSSERPVGLMCGSRVKSFVPAGFVRISETLPALAGGDLLSVTETNQVQVPFPENIRLRHPLLGYDFKETLAGLKKVKKRLSLARKQADLFYTISPSSTVNQSKSKSHKKEPVVSAKEQSKSKSHKNEPIVSVKIEPGTEVAKETDSSRKSRKRKQPLPEDVAEVFPTQTVKLEEVSPKKKKKSNHNNEAVTSTIKKEPVDDDDISWLLNI